MSSRIPSKIVFVGNIPYGLSEEQISDIFSSAGRVVNFRLVYDRENGKPKGFGFAEYPDPDSAASAVRNLNDYEVMGRKLRVDFSNEGDDIMLGGPFGLPGGSNGGNGGSNGAPAPTSSSAPILPPLPPGKDIPPGASAADEISRVLRTLPPTQLLDVLTQMKTLATNEPARATELLAQAPQLAYAVFQALLLMDLVSPEAIQAVVDPSATHAQAQAQAQAQPQAQPQQPPANHGYDASLAPAAPAQPVSALAPAAGAPMSQDELIKQVVELPQSVVDMLPEPDRTTVIALRMQFGGGAR
ncbi:rna recognition domain-containing protein [Ophiostoma piceae UAMH 11346]|uniref:Rna recognition domain-containing protein n=1 Tax=Ophiostoma piceae (strain UAMH 11346) TaxID=1262450 RepID=S3C4N9_OPHP1|nr:rna recognition domain-containing protein [Ophiostoma piceae UAMH 11346]